MALIDIDFVFGVGARIMDRWDQREPSAVAPRFPNDNPFRPATRRTLQHSTTFEFHGRVHSQGYRNPSP